MTAPRRSPILFLHGLFGSTGLLDPWTRLLRSAGHRVCVPTLPGRDPSDDAVLAPVPPGVLRPRLRSVPHLLPILPRVLAAEPFLPSPRAPIANVAPGCRERTLA